jgi:hypothetical protein
VHAFWSNPAIEDVIQRGHDLARLPPILDMCDHVSEGGMTLAG